MNEQPNELPISMSNTVISATDEETMREALQTAKRSRVDHKKEWYVKECGRLEEMLHDVRNKELRCRIDLINEQKKIDNPTICFAFRLLIRAIVLKVRRV